MIGGEIDLTGLIIAKQSLLFRNDQWYVFSLDFHDIIQSNKKEEKLIQVENFPFPNIFLTVLFLGWIFPILFLLCVWNIKSLVLFLKTKSLNGTKGSEESGLFYRRPEISRADSENPLTSSLYYYFFFLGSSRGEEQCYEQLSLKLSALQSSQTVPFFISLTFSVLNIFFLF